MNEERDELDELIVSENQPADKKLLATLAKRYIHSLGRNGVVDFKEEYDSLPSWRKIVIYLICRKIMAIKGIIENESAGPKEIAEAAKISEASAKDISRHKVLKKIVTGSGSGYYIQNYKLKRVEELMTENDPK